MLDRTALVFSRFFLDHMPTKQAKSSPPRTPRRGSTDLTGSAAPRGLLLGALLLLSSGVGAGKLRPGLRPVPYDLWSQGYCDSYCPGGYFKTAEGADSSIYFFSDALSKLDVDTGELHRIEPIGSVRPDARIFHAMCAVGAEIYVHAGMTLTTGGDHSLLCMAVIRLASWLLLSDVGMLQCRSD